MWGKQQKVFFLSRKKNQGTQLWDANRPKKEKKALTEFGYKRTLKSGSTSRRKMARDPLTHQQREKSYQNESRIKSKHCNIVLKMDRQGGKGVVC